MPTVTIPKETLKENDLIAVPEEDYREFSAWRDHVKVQLGDSWFWTPEWQSKEAEADVAIKKGKISKSFSRHQDLVLSLKSKKKL